jgi:hypothetical protein
MALIAGSLADPLMINRNLYEIAFLRDRNQFSQVNDMILDETGLAPLINMVANLP